MPDATNGSADLRAASPEQLARLQMRLSAWRESANAAIQKAAEQLFTELQAELARRKSQPC